MSERPVRTRYAPSPTGDPHVGNIRTALFAWALARRTGGQFLLRIEDTDRTRYVPSSLEAIYESLRWLGLEWDEGPLVGGPYAPYIQSERLPYYHKVANQLLNEGKAYRCFCTVERLDALRAEQQRRKQPPGYDGHCRSIPRDEAEARADEPHVIRFKMPRDGQTILHDAIRGEVVFENALQDDFVLLKSDGFPTYHLAAIADDIAMNITHVIRGEEWLSSAPKHIRLYEALGTPQPVWAHLPVILGTDRKKLSKRSGDTSVLEYRDKGYLPEAMVNFLALLGWSLDDKTTVVDRETFVKNFSLERVGANPAVFDIEKLDYLNGYYIRAMDPSRWAATVRDWCANRLAPAVGSSFDPSLAEAVAPLLQERVTRLSDIDDLVRFLFTEQAPDYPPEQLVERIGGDRELALRVINGALDALDSIPEDRWNRDTIEVAVRGLEDVLGNKLRKFISVLYVAIMGRPQGIPLFDSMALLGRERSLRRIRDARVKLHAQFG